MQLPLIEVIHHPRNFCKPKFTRHKLPSPFSGISTVRHNCCSSWIRKTFPVVLGPTLRRVIFGQCVAAWHPRRDDCRFSCLNSEWRRKQVDLEPTRTTIEIFVAVFS